MVLVVVKCRHIKLEKNDDASSNYFNNPPRGIFFEVVGIGDYYRGIITDYRSKCGMHNYLYILIAFDWVFRLSPVLKYAFGHFNLGRRI
jgi:hypothetical protein